MKNNKNSIILYVIIGIVLYLGFSSFSFATCNGKVSWYKRTNINGTEVKDVPVNTQPNEQGTYNQTEIPSNMGEKYGILLEGKICPTETTKYVFYIASDDSSELRLSTDLDKQNATKIASVPSWTNIRQWNKYAYKQRSSQQLLQAGQEYYIKTIMKDGGGGNHLAVGRKKGTRNRWGRSRSDIEIIQSQHLGQISICGNGILEEKEQCEIGNNTCEAGYTCRNNCTCEINNTICTNKIDNKLNYQEWTQIAGKQLSSIPRNTTPNNEGKYSIFESPQNYADAFGRKIKGYICVPVDGEYKFYIAADDTAELKISTDESPSNSFLIASVSSWTPWRYWKRQANQESSPINLQKGKMYYIEAIMKEGAGGDHISVGWKTPFNNTIEVIDNRFISSKILTICGNGLIEEGESCDDNNTTNQDGCSNSCQVEPTHICDGKSPTTCRRKKLKISGSGTYQKFEYTANTQQEITIPTNNILQLIDERGDNESRYITVSASDLVGSQTQYKISKDNMKIKINALQLISGIQNDKISIASTTHQSLATPVTIINKTAGENNGGIGNYRINSEIQITVPAYQTADIYHSILTFTLYE